MKRGTIVMLINSTGAHLGEVDKTVKDNTLVTFFPNGENKRSHMFRLQHEEHLVVCSEMWFTTTDLIEIGYETPLVPEGHPHPFHYRGPFREAR